MSLPRAGLCCSSYLSKIRDARCRQKAFLSRLSLIFLKIRSLGIGSPANNPPQATGDSSKFFSGFKDLALPLSRQRTAHFTMSFGWGLAVLIGNAVSAVSASGCGSAPTVQPASENDITLQNSNRSYLYWLPKDYDGSKPTPLIFSFHGAGGTAKTQADLDGLTTSEFNTDHILVYLQSTGDGENLWEVSPEVHVDDVAYTLEVLDRVQDELCIDDSRIYATGMSQGGGMVNLLACDTDASKRFAAYAPVAGAFYYEENKNDKCDPDNATFQCSPGRDDIPILAFQGGADDVVQYKGGSRRGGCLPNVGHWASEWAVREGLGPDVTEEEEITSAATKYLYGSGSEKGLVSLVYAGKKVGHVWPATVDSDGDEPGTASFNASSLIMEFFKEKQLPCVITLVMLFPDQSS